MKRKVRLKPRVRVDHSPIVSIVEHERARINRLNRQRGKQFEQEVAKLLGGLRVPMSGAGYLKGDVFARTYQNDLVLIECKFSSRDDSRGSFIVFFERYFERLIENAARMAAPYAVLAFRFFGSSYTYFCLFADNFLSLGGDITKLPYVEFTKSKTVHKITLDFLPNPFWTKLCGYDIVIAGQESFLALLEGTYGAET